MALYFTIVNRFTREPLINVQWTRRLFADGAHLEKVGGGSEVEVEASLRAKHYRGLTHDAGHGEAYNNGGEAAPDEPFPRLLGGEFDERGATEEESEDVGEAVVGDDHAHGEVPVDEALEHVGDHECALGRRKTETGICVNNTW